MSEHLQYLAWDSDFFGRRIARLTANRLDQHLLREAEAWCYAERIDCLYFLADADHDETVACAEAAGFHLVDLRITLDQRLPTGAPAGAYQPATAGVRMATTTDIPALRTMAAANHLDSRFYWDPHFPRARCDELYATWIEKSCTGYAEALLVAEKDAAAVGYLSCHLDSDRCGQIGLVGVHRDWQGHGLGRHLVAESLRWFSAAGAERVTVVTQGRNVAAQRLYQKYGFLTHGVQLWYHRWFSR
jgi:dTDP-4-amino-4,6-dideoxy-D-galactose acyltransferase